jgi:cystathionine beta-lyase/cystathionine gamma-synthase
MAAISGVFWTFARAGAHVVASSALYGGTYSLAQVATSLGGTHTVVSHVASTTHRQLDDRALAADGIDPGAVRFSIGLEDPEDLISDAYVALESLSRP